MPALSLSPGRAERHGFEYIRRGTLSLYAAIDTRTGKVIGKTTPSHTSQAFVAFLSAVVASRPKQEEIHLIADNLSAHKTARVKEFLRLHPNVHLHYTPTYSSWLNQVEIWVSKLERDLIARGIFTSTSDLNRKLMRYIREYNKTATPINCKYTDVTRRILAPHSAVTDHQEFLRFLHRLDRTTYPKDLDLHLVFDNYGTHTHPKVTAWLERRPRFHLHFTPTSSSWLNLIEV